MDLLFIAKFLILPVALGAVAVVLILGLANMARGGSPQRSQKLMQWRVLLQAVALCFVLATILLMSQS
ncbi:twin transmembrane helix small protein [Ancylobacter radicis]|uniref:Twin transmembrane helix small protein n=1 Tax=Ancylobacter radicis TaxID=2836179 RepID=A0ABS5R4D4_9HYPH|nr:twin transmembrane helix small protein [Ancylobacter radicis]MBS9476060.1 twin transmembrane helix small protein [Ancylobacter radicis]